MHYCNTQQNNIQINLIITNHNKLYEKIFTFLVALFALLMGVPPQAALAKAGDVVTNLSNLSNSKVYNIKSVRGYLLYSAN